jgi:hypothetical protein
MVKLSGGTLDALLVWDVDWLTRSPREETSWTSRGSAGSFWPEFRSS